MKKILITLISLVVLLNFNVYAQPANNNCNTAQSLGSLPTPGACTGGLQNGTAVTVAGTTVGATSTSPYTSIVDCGTGTADQASPAIDVWYSFVATGTTVNVNITPGAPALATPNIGLWTGTCAALQPWGCGIGNAAGNLTASFTQIVVGQTYYIQVSGNTATSTGNFNIAVDNDIDCNNCNTVSSMTASPMPVYGAYTPGQVVTFCYTISNWSQQNTNWLHGVQITMGAGWTGAITGTNPANTVQNIAGPGFDGAWYYSATGLGTGFGPGFYFETVSGGTDASNNFGDNGTGGWTFCWNLTVDPGCTPGSDLSVTINTSGDGESGSWNSTGCTGDPAFVFQAQGACCPPTMASTPTCSGTNNGTATATPVSAGTYTYSWAPGGQTTQTATGLATGTYTVTVTNTTTLCPATNTVTVTASTAPVANAGVDISLCSGVSGTIGTAAVAGITYLWSPTTGLSSSTVSNPTVTLTNATGAATTTNYTVTTTNASGCTATDIVVVTVKPIPVSNAGPDIAYCSGLTGTIGTAATAGYTYSWSPTTSLSSGTSSNPTVSLTNVTTSPASTTYTVTTTLNGCTSTDAVIVTVNPQPTSPFTPSANMCLTGNTFSFTNNGSSGAGYTQTWNFGGAVTNTSTAVSPTGVTYAASGTYTVTHTVTATGGCTSTTTASVTVYPMPVVTVTPSFAICAGMGTAGNLTASGASTYSWTPATGLSATTGATVTGNPATTTTYTVTGTSVNGCTATATVTITVNPIPVVASTPITICAGTPGILTASGASTYSWSPATGLSATTGTSVSANPPTTTTYTVTGTSVAGCSATTTVTVTVNPVPVTAVTSATVCPGQTATLTASGATTYSWTAGLSSTTGASVTGSPSVTTSYTVTGTSSGCSSTAVATITIGGSITPTVNSPTICAGQTATLTAGNATTYSWTSGLSATTGATVTGSPSTTTSYTVTGTSGGCTGTAVATITVNPLPVITVPAIAICAGTPGTLNASGASTYSWTPATGLSATTGASVTANPSATTTYTVTGTSVAGCVNTTTVVVTVNPLPTIVSNPITICSGIAGTLTAGGASTYTWAAAAGLSATTGASVSANPATTTTYTITGTSAAGCINTTSVIVTVNPLPTITVSPITICAGIAGTLTASGANTYTWSPSTGLSATTGATVSANPATTTTYTVTGTAATGCVNTASVVVTVTPAATLSITPVNVSCFGGTNGSATVSPAGGTTPYTYSWAPSGGIAATASGLTAGTYTVTVTTNNGCVSTLSTTITQPTGMTLTMASVNATCGSANGQASVSATGGTSPYTYAWTPSGGSGSTATALTAGSYTVTVTDNNGCTSTNSVAVNNSLSPSASTTVIANVSCFGGTNGSASVSISGGSSPYTQSWSPSGGTGTTASGLAAGTYTVTVTDNVGCIVTANAIITQPPVLTASTVKTDVSCFAGTNGTATVTAGGGTSPYTYSWSPSGGTGATASSLAAGTYTVTVTDFRGCTTTATAIIAQPTIITGTTSTTPVSCFGGTNGSASVVAGGGTPGYSYSWAPAGGTGATASGLSSGTYTVTITDLNGCIRTASTTVTQPTLLSVSTTNVSSTCGLANGSASATATGGTAGYSYTWSPSGGSSSSASGLAAATYTVTVTDANGCTATSSTTVNDLSGILASITAQANVTCFGLSNGTVTVTASGSTAPYTYSINGGGTFQVSGTFGSLAAGNYTIIAKDANGCTVSVPVTITEPSALTGAISAQTNVLCNGANTGSVTVAGSGGTITYTYSLNGGTFGSSGTFSPLTAGSYTVTVRDNNACTVTVPVIITQPAALTAAITSQTNNICFAGNTGSVTVNGSGGTIAYTYSLNGGTSQSTGTFSGMIAGTYTVTVTDANSCTATVPVTITQPTQVTVTATKVDATCGAANGALTATGANGTPGYTYSINGTTFQSGGSFTGLVAATYTVTVSDVNGCTNTTTISIIDLSGLTASITSQTNVSCNGGSNGSMVITAGGSVPAYIYSLNGGTFGPSGTFSGLTANTYTVTAQDGNGCTVTVPVTITQPPVLTGAISTQTNINCFGSTNGSVTVAASGGTTVYAYSIDGGAFGSSATFTGLSAGPHSIVIRDANGCTFTIPVTITQPSALTLATSSVNAICTAANGSATVIASGATPAYTYLWAPGGQTTSTASNITAGNYSVLVTDFNGCTQTANVSVGANPGGTASILSSNNVTCSGANNGNATVTMSSGATPPYTYAWTPSSQTTVTAINLGPGSYSVTVTDGNGCIASTNVVITEPTVITNSFTNANVTCFGSNNGLSTVNPSGGTAPYTYLWSPSGQTTQTAGGLTAGTYTVVITDANGCTRTATTAITEPPAMALSETHIDANCNLSNGSATVSVAGGVGPYAYSWSTLPVAQTNDTALALAANTYVATVTDANGCSQNISVTINNLAGPVATVFATNNVSCNGQSDGDATITVSGGTPPFNYSWTPSGGSLATATNLAAGTYTMNATDVNGCSTSAAVTITEPAVMTTTYTSTNPTCNGASNGTITSTTNGGTAPYTYLWTPGGATTSNLTGAAAGTYLLQATDVNGCITATNITLNNPPALTASTTTTNITCSGLCNGTATVNVVNGTGPINYLWSDINAQATPTATVLCAGTYSVTATDANGCTVSSTAVISTPSSIAVTIINYGNVTCYGACDGYAAAAVTGGTAPFSYMWMPSGTAGSSVNNLCAASYTVTVTDANGCTASTTVNITQPNPLIASITNTDVSCYGACDAQATAVYTGGTGPYTFLWTPALQTTPTVTGLCAGIQNLEVTDSIGCTAYSSAVITEPTILAVTTTTTNSNCGSSVGTACASITGGSPPFNYSWNDPMVQTNSCATGLDAGIYTISVTDSHGCSVTNVANVNDNGAPVVTIPTSTDVTCFGAANGSAQGSITGGIIPYTIGWAPGGQTNTFINGLSGGIYSLLVTDSVGCTGSASVTINEPSALISGIISSFNTSCNLACDGSATVLAGGGTAPYTYLWNDVATQTTATATNLCAQNYSVTVTDANGCSSVSIATISEPAPIAITVVSTTNVLCNGGNNGQITVSASGGTPGYTYSWSPSVGSSSSVTNLVAGTYQLTVTDLNGCSRTINIDITQPTPLALNPNSNFSTCGNSNGSAGVSVTGGTPNPGGTYTYLWSPGGSTSAIVTNVPAGTYSVTVTDASGCTATVSSTVADSAGPVISNITFTEPSCTGLPNGTATVVATGGQPLYSYSWNTTPVQTSQMASALTAGVYQVVVSDQNNCEVTGTVIVTEPAPLQIITNPIDTICIGQLSQIYAAGSGGTPAYTYTWSPSIGTTGGPFVVTPTTSTTYTVTAVDANGCVSAQQFPSVFVNPQIDVVATDVSVCDGNAVTISASATGGTGGPYTYSWSNGASGASQSVSPTGAVSVDYIVTANDIGCSIATTDTSTVVINPLAVSFMSVPAASGCEDFSTTFTGLSNIGTTYSWNFGDGSGTFAGTPITHTYTTSGTYTVVLTVTTALGCTSSVTEPNYITVFPSPVAGFTSNPQPAYSTAPLVSFVDQSSGGNEWDWDFIYTNPQLGLYTDTLQNPTFSYPDSGIYIVQQVVTNSFGCTDTAYNNVEIIPEYVFFAPNAFTPNNHDGINDVFMPKGVGIDPNNFEMYIFDRWGNLIYKTTDVTKGWDGTANGGKNVAQIDVYVWKVKTQDFRGEGHSYVGHVTIVK
jgi:gliding motility-associated-like protein